MGCFDTITVKYNLPKPTIIQGSPNLLKICEFQTKDLGQTLGYFEMREDGTLWKLIIDGVYEPNPEYKKGELFSFPTRFKETGRDWVQENYHGALNFYEGYHGDTNEPVDIWLEYTALYSKGVLQSIELTKYEETDNTDRKKRRQESEAQMREYHIRTKKWWFKPYFFLRGKIINAAYKLHTATGWFHMLLVRHL